MREPRWSPMVCFSFPSWWFGLVFREGFPIQKNQLASNPNPNQPKPTNRYLMVGFLLCLIYSKQGGVGGWLHVEFKKQSTRHAQAPPANPGNGYVLRLRSLFAVAQGSQSQTKQTPWVCLATPPPKRRKEQS